MSRWARRCGRDSCWPRGDPLRPSEQKQLVLGRARIHFGAGRIDVDVDLAAYAEALRQVDARLDREPDARHQGPRVLGLEVVDVRPRAVQIAVDRMPDASTEAVAHPRVPDHAARRV